MSTDKQLVKLIETAGAALEAIRDYLLSKSDGLGARVGMLTVAEIAGRLRVSPQTLRKGHKRGRYPFFFREGVRLVTTEALFGEWLDKSAKRAGAK